MLFTAERMPVMKSIRMLCLLFSLLLVSCSALNEPRVSPVITTPEATPTLLPATATEKRTELLVEKSANFPDLDIVTDIDWQDHYRHAVHYPLLSRPEIDHSIRKLMDERIENYKVELEHARNDSKEEVIPELLIEYDIKYFSDKHLSVLFTENKFWGGGNQEINLFSINVSFEQNKLLQLENIFKANVDYLLELSQFSREKFENSNQLNQYYDPQWIKDGTVPERSNFDTFIITEHALEIYFNMHQIAHRDAGIQSITIKYSQWNDYWDENNIPYKPTPPVHTPTPEPTISAEQSPLASDDKEQVSALPPSATPPAAKPKRRIALTFDDGPHKSVTPMILDILKKKGGKATFFVLGNRVEYYPEIMQRIVDEGHEIGNHSWNHSELTKLNEEEIKEQFDKTQQAVFDTVAIWPNSIRPPYGAYDETVQAIAHLPLVMWSVDTLDWKHRNKNKTIKAALAGAKEGSVILFHDLYSTTADALGPIMDKLIAQDYEFVTVSELFGLQDEALAVAGQIYHNGPPEKK